MKNLFQTLSLSLLLSLSLNAQLKNSNVKVDNNLPKSDATSNSAKLDYIEKQNYLSPSAVMSDKLVYGDSLKGFDEAAIKVSLIGHNVFGSEYAGYIKLLKREYINKKYNIGIPLVVTNPNSSNGNPSGGNNTSGGGKNLGGTSVINVSPCINEGFENTPSGTYVGATNSLAVQGWTLWSATVSSCGTPNWQPGATEFSVFTTPIINFPLGGCGSGNTMNIGNSPLGGTKVVQMNNCINNNSAQRMKQTFPVTNANNLFQFAFAGYWQNGGHNCCEQPGFNMQMLGCNNNVLNCASIVLGIGCPSVGATFTNNFGGGYCNWQVKYVDLTPYIGSCVTVELWTTDCIYGGHMGYTVFDAVCANQLLAQIPGIGGVSGYVPGPVSFCQGSGIAQISAPLGYASYQWVAPGGVTVSAPQGTMSTLTVTNPIPNSVYTVYLITPSGCQYVSTNTIVFTQVAVAGIGSNSSCLNGASGTATVLGNGSGAGYSYTWTNSSNSVVGTNSVLMNVPAGIYSITLTGAGNAGCGTAGTTVNIGVAPQALIPVNKPYCGSTAYLTTAGGSQYSWYQGTSLVSGPNSTITTYTVTSNNLNSTFYLSYMSNLGCRDSLQYNLIPATPGQISASNITSVCPAASNGSAVISLTPTAFTPPNLNSFSVTNLNNQTPNYNASVFPTSATVFPVSGLSAGSYSVTVFDGSCNYNTTFNVAAIIFNYTLLPTSTTLCPGVSVNANVNFGNAFVTPGQYTYSWSPNQFLGGNFNTGQNALVTPVISPGTNSTIVYTVVVTPTVLNCPLTKTLAIYAVNPPAPTITAIPPLCDNGLPYQIVISPLGGTYTAIYSGTNNPINSTGVINPGSSGLSLGTNYFNYAIMVYTCQATQSGSFEISHFNTAALTSSINPLCVTSPQSNLMNIVQSANTGTWTGQGVLGSGSNFSFNPAGLNTNTYTISYNTSSNPNPTACPMTSTLAVSVTNTLIPAIAQVPPFCTNAAPFSMTVNPGGGTWSNPMINPQTGIVTPSIVTTNSIVNYVVNIGPCVNTNSTSLTVSQFNPATLTGTIPNLCYNSASFNLNNIVQSQTFGSWSGTSINSNSFVPSGLPTGTYSLVYTRVSTPNASLCPDQSTIEVSVYNPPSPNITSVGPLCSKDAPVQMNVSPAIGYWVNSSFLSLNGLLTPSMCSIGNNAVQYVIGNGTCFTQSSKIVVVEAFNSAAISKNLPDQCNTSAPFNLGPLTSNNTGVWSGVGIAGSNFNPATAGSGSFVLTYQTASSPSGLCPDQSTIAVRVYSLAAPVISEILPLCNSSKPVQLNVSPLGGIFGGVNNYGVSLKGLFSPGLGVIGNNIINYSISAGPCVAYGQTTINVEKFISADFDHLPKAAYCVNVDKPDNLNQYVLNPGGTWIGKGMVGSIFHPELVDAGVTIVTYSTHPYPIDSLCPDTKTIALTVAPEPKISVSLNVPPGGCAPFEIVMNIPNTNKGTGTWNFGDGSEPKTGLTTTHIYTASGTYTAVLNYISTEGCPAPQLSVNPSFTVYDQPAPNFSIPDEILISNPEIQISNTTRNVHSNKYRWKIPGLYQINDEINPFINFPKVGKYQITLVAISLQGCTAEITKNIEVKNDFNVFIPSSFSPNFDGLNDVFKPEFTPYGLDSKSFEMEIFDRWGHSLYYTKDPTKGWDGSVSNKGEPLKEEVYVYKIKYKDVDGNLYDKMGHVTLLK